MCCKEDWRKTPDASSSCVYRNRSGFIMSRQVTVPAHDLRHSNQILSGGDYRDENLEREKSCCCHYTVARLVEAVLAVSSWEEQQPQLSEMLEALVEDWPRFLVIDFFTRLVPGADAAWPASPLMRYARSHPEWWAPPAIADALLPRLQIHNVGLALYFAK